jgi:hypothetical protein
VRGWAYLLGGLLIWAVHFFAVYAAASIFLTTMTTRVIALLLTLLCLAGAGWLTWRAWERRGKAVDPFGRWTHHLAALSGAAGFIAVAWQGLPAILI